MKQILILVSLILATATVNCQLSTVIPSSSSLAETSVANTQNYSAFTNPSTLGYIAVSEFGFQVENKYLINELSTKSVQLALKSKYLNTSITFSHLGYSLYHEMLIGACFARNFGDKFSLGLAFNYYTAFYHASNSYRGAIVPQVGLTTKLSSKFSIGFSVFNPIQSTIKSEYTIKRIPSIFSLGTEYFFSPEFVWRTQIDKELSSNYRFASAFEYKMLKSATVKLGAYGSEYLVPCVGLGIKISTFHIDLNCETHPILGLTTFVGIKYKFQKNN